MTDSGILRDVQRYYEARLREFGPTARGVDWNGTESQRLRFAQLLQVLEPADRTGPVEILDVGCGYGALVEHLREQALAIRYVGYDISEEMLETAERLFGDSEERVRFVREWEAVPPADVAVASGVFHVRLSYDESTWREYVLDSLRAIHQKARSAWAANFLTIYSDEERMRPDLYYADPGFLFDWCKRHLAGEVAVLHDYGLYEFTLIIRRLARGRPR